MITDRERAGCSLAGAGEFLPLNGCCSLMHYIVVSAAIWSQSRQSHHASLNRGDRHNFYIGNQARSGVWERDK